MAVDAPALDLREKMTMSKSQKQAIKLHIKRRNKALLDLDIAWAHQRKREETGEPFHAARSEITGEWRSPDDVALMSLHMARIQCHGLPPAAIAESRQWLRARGLTKFLEEHGYADAD